MENINIDDKTKQAAEGILSKGISAVLIPLKGGGIRVKKEMRETVYVQEAAYGLDKADAGK